VNTTPGDVPEEVLFHFGLIYVAILLFVVSSLKVFWPYDLSQERHEEIKLALAKRRTASESGLDS